MTPIPLLLEASITARQHKLTMTQLCVLGLLHQSSQWATGKVAQAIGTGPMVITGIIQLLVERKLLVRSPDPKDRRKVMVALSKKGKQKAVEIWGDEG